MSTVEMEQVLLGEGVSFHKDLESNRWQAEFADEIVATHRQRGNCIWAAAEHLNIT